MKYPKISVIMGTYNPDRNALFKSVESIRNQTFHDWEMIIYDDGSNEESQKYINTLCSSDSRIRLIRGECNRGLSYGLNQCLKVSSGQYIARMDDDDISAVDRFDTQTLFLDSHNEYSWVGCLANLFDSGGIWGIANRPEIPQKKDFLHSSPFIHPGVMFRKEVLQSIGGYSEEKITLRCEDYDLFMRLYAKGYKGYNIQRPLIDYNQRKDCISRNWKYSFYEAVVRYHGFRKLKLLNITTSIYILKPVMVKIAAFLPGLAQFLRTAGGKGDIRV